MRMQGGNARRFDEETIFIIVGADVTAHAYEKEKFTRIRETEISVKT